MKLSPSSLEAPAEEIARLLAAGFITLTPPNPQVIGVSKLLKDQISHQVHCAINPEYGITPTQACLNIIAIIEGKPLVSDVLPTEPFAGPVKRPLVELPLIP